MLILVSNEDTFATTNEITMIIYVLITYISFFSIEVLIKNQFVDTFIKTSEYSIDLFFKKITFNKQIVRPYIYFI